MNTIHVYFFATLKDVAGMSHMDIQVSEGASVADLKVSLIERIADFERALPNAVISVNQDYAEDEVILPDGAEVAIFPPVSGGSPLPSFSSVSAEAFDLNSVLNQITLPTTGAACFFVGMVRQKTALESSSPSGETLETHYLEYEAYHPMAEAKLNQIIEEIRQRFPGVEGVALTQRVGHLDPGTPAVVVACSAAHRDSGAFEAARYGIERLKQIVPVWKKEVGPAGAVWVEGDTLPQSKKD